MSIQYQLNYTDVSQVEQAWYKPDEAGKVQPVISAFTADILRTKVAKLTIDECFVARTELQHDVAEGLSGKIGEYGYRIVAVLVTGMEPARNIKASMNDIYVQSMMKIANQQKAEGLKIMEVIKAQGKSEQTHLLGKGTAMMREAIAQGLAKTSTEFCDALNEVDRSAHTWSKDDVLYLQILMQEIDTFKAIGNAPNPNKLVLTTGVETIQAMKRGLDIGT